MNSARFLSFLGLVAILAIGCASTRLTDVWKDKAYKGDGVSSILVVAVTAKQENRLLFERHLANALKKTGVTAVISSEVLSRSDNAKKEDIQKAARERGCDSIITTHLVGISNKEVYQPPVYDRNMYSSAYTFSNYYPAATEYVTAPGAVYEQKEVRLETNLYDTDTEALLWRASSETVDPKSAGKAVSEISALLAERLKKSGLLKTK